MEEKVEATTHFLQSAWKPVWQYLLKVRIWIMPFDPEILHLSKHPTEIIAYVH